MSMLRAIGILGMVSLFLTVTAWLLNGGRPTLTRNERPQEIQMEAKKDACVFLERPEVIDSSTRLSRIYKDRMQRESYGYPHELPVNEALRIFNSELTCYPFWARLPPLTEQEVLANMIGGPDYGGENAWRSQRQVLKEIVEKKVMPKGSLFVAEPGGCEVNTNRSVQACVKGLKIYLFLGLDKVPREAGVTSAQIVLLRKTYLDIESR